MIGSFVFMNPPVTGRKGGKMASSSWGLPTKTRRRRRALPRPVRRARRKLRRAVRRVRRADKRYGVSTRRGQRRLASKRTYVRRRRRNPLYRYKRGVRRWGKRGAGRFAGPPATRRKKRLHRYRTGPKKGRWHNPRRRRVARRNAGFGGFTKLFSMETFKQTAEIGAGFAIATGGTNLVLSQTPWLKDQSWEQEKWTKPIATALVAGGAGWATMRFYDHAAGQRVLIGGLLAAAFRAINAATSAGSEIRKWVPTLGDSETDAFRSQIESDVLNQLRAGNEAYYMPAAGSSSYYMPAAGSQGYLTANELQNTETRAGLAGMNGYLTAREGEEIDVFGVAGGPTDEFGSGGGPRERF